MIRRHAVQISLATSLLLVAGTAVSQDNSKCIDINAPATTSYDFTKALTRWGSENDYRLDAPSRIVHSLSVNTLPIFDESNPREDNLLFRWANAIHFTTRQQVISDQLLFKEGEPATVHLLAESERILRSRHYVGDAAIRVLRECGNSVDLEVVSREVWTLTPDLSFKSTGGDTSAGIGLRDSNILGSGQFLDIKYKQDPQRSSWAMGYKNPNIGGTHAEFTSEIAQNSDGHHYLVDASQPFYSLNDKHSWRVLWESTSEVLNQYTYGTKVSGVQHDSSAVEFIYGSSNGIVDGSVNRFSAGARVSQQSWQKGPDLPAPVGLRSSLDLNYPFLQYDYIEDKYVTGFNIGQIKRTEDLQLGKHVRSRIGYAGGAGGNVIFNGDFGDTLLYHPGRLLQLSASWDGRWNRETARLEDTLLKASLDYQMELSQRRTLFLGLVANKVYNLNNGTQLILGGSNGLRGYDSHFLNGTGNVQFTAEERYFTDYHWLQLARVGFAMFYDAGRVFGNTDAGAQRLYQNVGFGLRLAPSRSESGQIVHVDLAWPLNSNVPGGGGRQFVVEVKDTF